MAPDGSKAAAKQSDVPIPSADRIPGTSAPSSHTNTKDETLSDPSEPESPTGEAHQEEGRGEQELEGRAEKRRPWTRDKRSPPTERLENPEVERDSLTRTLPILSGLLCPFSVLLDWYVKTDGYTVIETQPNPALLDAGQAVSMALGVLANIALILRFLETRQYAATWVAILSLAAHDVINIVIVSVFGIVHSVDDGFTYGTAFWLTVASTATSVACSFTLVLDFWRTPDFRNSGSGLTTKQRSLVVATMLFLVYIGLGALCFSYLIEELAFIDAMYFVVCTISSVGFGDIVPSSVGSRIFCMFYAVGGLASLAFMITVARGTILESFETSYRARRDALAKKAKERREEKRRRLQAQKERRVRELREDVETGAEEREGRGRRYPPFVSARGRRVTTLTAEDSHSHLSPEQAQRQLDYFAEKDEGMSTIRAKWRQFKRRYGWLESRREVEDEGLEGDETMEGGASLSRRTSTSSAMSAAAVEERYASFRKQLRKEQDKEFRLKISLSMALFFVFWLGGGAVFVATEKWTYFNALWFSFIYFSTIGYGDFSPKTAAGRAFFVVWALLGIANLTLLLSVITETWSARYKSTINDGKVRRRLKKLERNGESNGSANVSRLLALEGFEHEDEVEVKDLPKKLSDAVKGFHDHARYFMLGRTGEPPERYQTLVHAAELDSEFAKMIEAEAIASEAGGNGDARHFLFMVAYEREFETLSATAQQLTQVFEKHAEELETMRRLNADLRRALIEKESQSEVDEEDEVVCEEQEAEEEAIAEEEEEEKEAERRAEGSDAPPSPKECDQSAECNTLDTSSTLLDRIDTRGPTATSTARLPPSSPLAERGFPSLSPWTRLASAPSPPPPTSPTSALTFAEPERVIQKQKSSSASGSARRA